MEYQGDLELGRTADGKTVVAFRVGGWREAPGPVMPEPAQLGDPAMPKA